MAKSKSKYVCQNCGYETVKWLGKCPGCGSFNTLEEEVVSAPSKVRGIGIQSSSKPQRLKEIMPVNEGRATTGMGELDRVLGGGLVEGSLTLIGGDPGIGKSTLLLQICSELGKQGKNILYVSGEESPQQVKLRADRLNISSENIKLLSETNIGVIDNCILNEEPDFIIIDSIQTMYTEEAASAPGSVTQVRETTAKLMNISKGRGISVMIVGHVTKDGSIAGPRVLEHMVDTVLYFEGDKTASYRILRAVKNRFGGTNEIGVFEMGNDGLKEILNPSAYMLSDRPLDVPGTAITCSMEGTRPLLIEVQSLVSYTTFNMPRRMATGTDFNRVVIIIAVLEKRAGLQLSSYDSYINITGGIKVAEPAIDAAVAVAIASSYRNVPVNSDTLILGEIGLTGELRAVSMAEKRVQEAQKMGFKTCIVPKANYKEASRVEGIKIVCAGNVDELLEIAL
ncbi:MAG: DNA repair protein RadA [Clostridia bacterium]|nr:DNA repair protein RadA [Clostridia bacterium]